jgi:hypothetical protein
VRASFDAAHLEELARSLGFIRRSDGKLTAEKFLIALLYCASQDECSSLENMCAALRELGGIEIRKQSLDERFSEACHNFIKSLLREVLSGSISTGSLYESSFWKAFKRVRLKDSTKFKVPDVMCDEFKGNGGSLAGVCIQHEYDLKSGEVLEIEVTSGGGNDRTVAKLSSDKPQAGELVIRDLGYYSLEVFQKFIDNKVYFLSKLYPKSIVYTKDRSGRYKKVDFHVLYQKMSQEKMKSLDVEVFLGKEYKIPVRMVLSLSNEEAYEKRVRERERENRKRGQKLSEKTRIRYRFNAFVTNARRELLPACEIFSAYRLRWQIELTFKMWKSTYRLHMGRKMKKQRFIVMLYIKLILILINMNMMRALQHGILHQKGIQREKRNLSMFKVMATLRKKFNAYTYHLFFGNIKEKEKTKILIELQRTVAENHWLDVRKDKNNISNINTLFY